MGKKVEVVLDLGWDGYHLL